MTPRGKLFLALAVTGTTLAVLAGKKKANAAPAEPLPELPEPPESDEEAAPAEPTPIVIPRPPIPPPIQFDDRDEKDKEEDELTGGPPRFVPPPISNEPPRRGPPEEPPPVQLPELPPVQIPPELEEVPDLLGQLPGIVPPPLQSGGIDIPTPTVPRPKPPLQSPPDRPDITVLQEDTEQVLQTMLPKEATKDWKRKEPVLELWQEERGRPVDGKFGPGDALTMAKETGLLPIIRFWPKGSLIETGAVDDYRRELLREARNAEEPRKSQLRAAADREQGQAFARNPEPISPTIQL